MSDGTVNRRSSARLWGKPVSHGFRALARTVIRENLGYDSKSLKGTAHKLPPLGEAYDGRSFWITPEDDEHWSDYLDAVVSEQGDAGNFKKKA